MNGARPPGAYIDEVTEWAAAQAKAEHDLIERACEAALQTGRFGVLVIRGPKGIEAGPDPSVPFGVIHERRLG